MRCQHSDDIGDSYALWLPESLPGKFAEDMAHLGRIGRCTVDTPDQGRDSVLDALSEQSVADGLELASAECRVCCRGPGQCDALVEFAALVGGQCFTEGIDIGCSPSPFGEFPHQTCGILAHEHGSGCLILNQVTEEIAQDGPVRAGDCAG